MKYAVLAEAMGVAWGLQRMGFLPLGCWGACAAWWGASRTHQSRPLGPAGSRGRGSGSDRKGASGVDCHDTCGDTDGDASLFKDIHVAVVWICRTYRMMRPGRPGRGGHGGPTTAGSRLIWMVHQLGGPTRTPVFASRVVRPHASHLQVKHGKAPTSKRAAVRDVQVVAASCR